MGYTAATPGRPGCLFVRDKQNPSGKALIVVRHQLSSEAKEEIIRQLGQLLSQREEVDFACVHGSFLESSRGFRDIDIGVWVYPSSVVQERTLDYEWELSAWLERHTSYPIDVKALNYTSIGFRHAASGGTLVFARDADLWYQFRERTWIGYLDFAPLSKQMLFDLLNPSAWRRITMLLSTLLNCPKTYPNGIHKATV
jgi:predicted nucleotidyltransferase